MPQPVMHPVLAFGHHLDYFLRKRMVIMTGHTSWAFCGVLMNS
jgi:hypothetical protein